MQIWGHSNDKFGGVRNIIISATYQNLNLVQDQPQCTYRTLSFTYASSSGSSARSCNSSSYCSKLRVYFVHSLRQRPSRWARKHKRACWEAAQDWLLPSWGFELCIDLDLNLASNEDTGDVRCEVVRGILGFDWLLCREGDSNTDEDEISERDGEADSVEGSEISADGDMTWWYLLLGLQSPWQLNDLLTDLFY